MRVLWGTVSLRISSRLPGSSSPRKLKPVMFPPGCARLATNPCPTGSAGGGHHDRDRARGVLGRTDRGGSLGHNHVHWEPDQLGRLVAETLFAPLRIAVLNNDVLALDIAELAQPLLEGF